MIKDIFSLKKYYRRVGWHKGGWFFLCPHNTPIITHDYKGKPNGEFNTLEVDRDTLEVILMGKQSNVCPYHFNEKGEPMEGQNNPLYIKTAKNRNSVMWDGFLHFRIFMFKSYATSVNVLHTKLTIDIEPILSEYLKDLTELSGVPYERRKAK